MAGPTSEIFVDHETIRLSREGIFLTDRDGSGFEPIEHARTVEAFHRYLGRDEEGYFIEIGRDHKRIEVEDTARFVREIDWQNDGVELTLLDGTRERLQPETLAYRPERLVCRVREGKEEARFLRVPYHEFLMRALQEGDQYVVRIGAKSYRIA